MNNVEQISVRAYPTAGDKSVRKVQKAEPMKAWIIH